MILSVEHCLSHVGLYYITVVRVANVVVASTNISHICAGRPVHHFSKGYFAVADSGEARQRIFYAEPCSFLLNTRHL